MMFKAKKSLGQNFLKSQKALRQILEAGEVKYDNLVLEIGPGKGALTEKLLEAGAKVLAIEKDGELYEFLGEKFQNSKLSLENKDILEFDSNSLKGDYKLIANIPYNITGAIIKKFLTCENQPKLMVLMVQYEVAKRILAQDGKESLLSISVKAYGAPKFIAKVSKKYFSPSPKVDSAIILIENISKNTFSNENIEENSFWKIVKVGFAHKRKKLLKNLKNLDLDTNLEQIFDSLNLPENIRAEDLKIKDWINLSRALNPHK